MARGGTWRHVEGRGERGAERAKQRDDVGAEVMPQEADKDETWRIKGLEILRRCDRMLLRSGKGQ